MRTRGIEKKQRMTMIRFGLLLVFLSTASLVSDLTPLSLTAYAAEKLATPKPVKESAFTVTWARVSQAASYDVRLTLKNTADGKTVTRSFSTASNRVDLTLFAAECSVSVEVRAVPASGAKKKYSASGWGACGETVEPAENNTTSGYAEASGDRFLLADENGTKYTGWKKVNNAWFYLDPANGGRTALGWTQAGGSTYYFEENGRMHTGWLAWKEHWYYLNPASDAEGKMVTGWFEVAPGRPYYFTENAASGQPLGSLNESVTTASCPGSTPPYPLSTASSAGGAVPQPGVSNGWYQDVNETWAYYVNGSPVKNAWKNVDGFWYYFNGEGIMQQGWQRVGGLWYYFEPNKNGSNGYKYGAAWMNTTTPDGYTVNEKGQWTENGQVVTGDGSGKNSTSGSSQGSIANSSNPKQIKSVLISLNVTDPRGGRCRYAEVSAASDCVIRSQNCGTAYADWTPGSPVIFTVELEPKSGYIFTTGMKFRCSGGSVAVESGDALRRTVKVTYTPTAKLDAPQVFYITDSNELKWMPVPYAKRYRVTITGGNAQTATAIVTSPCIDLWNYGDIDASNMTATVSALGSEDSKTTGESEKTTVSDLGSYKKGHRLNGTFVLTNGIMRFQNEIGITLIGWQQLCGNWFYFKKGGAAAGPGWFRDESGYWYYFDSCYRMMTGTVTDGGKTYFLNDGSRSGLPLGAWVQ